MAVSLPRLFKPRPDGSVAVENNCVNINTGDWRWQVPEVDPNLCKRCGLCYMYCPVGCKIELVTHFDTDLEFCKGCGICAYECPAGAITMVPETRR